MNSELDVYLEKVEVQLRSLPAAMRTDELRELRQHLEAIVARLSSDGLNHAEAVAAAIAQFGAAQDIGHELQQAHREPESVCRFVVATVAAVGCYLSLLPMYRAGDWTITPEAQLLHNHGLGYMALYWLLPFTSGLLAGGIAKSSAGRVTACVGVLVAALMTTYFTFWPLTLVTFIGTLLAGVTVGSQRTLQISLEPS